MAGPVHFELYVRRTPSAPWSLECAMEDRSRLTETAEQLMEEGRVAAVRATKETFDTDTGQFASVTLFSRGHTETKGQSKTPLEDRGPICVTPQDLYTVHAREKIGRLLDGWLKRKGVTAFELLHRPDLLEQLEASGVEVQHALQKVAIPEAQARGLSVHEMIRQLQDLTDRAIARVRKDAKSFPTLTPKTFASDVERLTGAEPLYILGGGISRALTDAKGWRAKVGVLVELAEAAPAEGRARSLALAALEPPLAEILGASAGVSELFGADLDMGGALGALACLAAPREAQAVRAADASAARALPPLTPEAQRLSALMSLDAFEGVRSAIGRRVLAELNGPRRLRPDDANGEILLLRALAMVLTASAGRLLPMEDVQVAFVERSKRLVAADFVESFLKTAAAREGTDILVEARALVRLAENVAGVMNKRAAARWLSGSLFALRFEKDLRAGREGPSTRLAALADLYRALAAARLPESELAALRARIGEAGGWVEADAHLCALLAASGASVPTRCLALASIAMGESAPPGPAADRAAAELLKLMRDPNARATLTHAPEAAARVRDALSAKAA